jgi:ribosomal protein L11 methyltransferase
VEIGPDLVDEPDAALAWQQYVSGAAPDVSLNAGSVLVRAYLPNEAQADDLQVLAKRVAGLGDLGLDPGSALVTTRIVHEEDWANAWKRFYTTQHIGSHIVIVPSWVTYEAQADDVVIVLDPGMAFGTGTHPTTRLCLAVLEDIVRPDSRVLDVGTGSGILAIAAAKFGARVAAFDIDARAAAVAAHNAEANGVGGLVETMAGTLAAAPKETRYDIIVANIVADTILAILPEIVSLLKPGGCFVASGIVESRSDEVLAAWRRAGLAAPEVHVSDEWVCMVGGLL